MKILIVDDIQDVRETLKALIKMIAKGVEVSFEEAENAEQAIALLRAGGTYSAVLTDYDMPSNGEGLAVVAIARERLPSARIALMSARMDDDIAQLAKIAGADKALSKPAHINQWHEFLFAT